jgi:DNA invertase Pin-like site-specific DNA recombinase
MNPAEANPRWETAKLKFRSTEERDNKIVEMMKAKGKKGQLKKVQEIADAFGLSRIRIYQIIKKKNADNKSLI